MNFADKIRAMIIQNTGTIKNSLLTGEHRMTPLMVHLLANVHFSRKYGEANGSTTYLYAEIGEFKPYSAATVRSLENRGLITVTERHCDGGVLYIVTTEKGKDICKRAYNELGRFDENMLKAPDSTGKQDP